MKIAKKKLVEDLAVIDRVISVRLAIQINILAKNILGHTDQFQKKF